MATYKKTTVGSIGVILRFTLQKPDGTVWDLTDATVTMTMQGGNTETTVTGTCTIDNALTGTCHYDLTANDTKMPGKYELSCEIKKSHIDGGNEVIDLLTGSITQGELEII